MRFLVLAALLMASLSSVFSQPPTVGSLELWYSRPAQRWLESLPVGNGRIGAMVFGGMPEERIALNESTFWSGAFDETHDNPASAEAFARIRELFKAGRHTEAAPLIPRLFGRKGNYGTSLPAGDLLFTQDDAGADVSGFRRELDLDEGIARVTWTAGGTHYAREVIASHPAGLLVVRLSADRPGRIGFVLRYKGGAFPWHAEAVDKGRLAFLAHALEKNHSDGKCGTRLHGWVQVLPEGGTLRGGGDSIRLTGANAATVIVALNTDFQDGDPSSLGLTQIGALRSADWTRLRAAHVADQRRLFRRVSLALGAPAPASLPPTDERLAAVRRGAADPSLDALFFQFGRYLTMAGSREDSPLPMHLQGLWNDSLAAAMGWTCDYHLDINTEQNYWLSECANLPECGMPLFRLVESLQAPGHHTARTVYGINHGWVCHVFSNPWGFTSPGWWEGWGLHVTGGAWIATHLWEHYQFTQDRAYLASQAYPVLKGAAEFFLDYLYTDPMTGRLSTGPSVSPERGGEAGPGGYHDRALVYEIFTACIEGSRILGVDGGFRDRLTAARDQLPSYRVGRTGQLQEWVHRDDGGDTEHRHTSHLVGLFPLAQITPRATPELARAAARSIALRMGRKDWEDVEWSAGNAVCYHARLGDGEAAFRNLHNLMTADTDANLMTYSRGGVAGAAQNIFCVDGNTSGAAGIAEMLLQSHEAEIELLPALPAAWASGRVTGLRARGGFTVDIEWRQSRVVAYRVSSPEARAVTLRVNGEVRREAPRPVHRM
jgi:alpha-L-fucosidase 2